MKNKFLSRKFLVSIAAMLGSIGTSIAGLHTDNSTVAIVGVIATIVSAAIYAFTEAWVDQAYVSANPQAGAAAEDSEEGEE